MTNAQNAVMIHNLVVRGGKAGWSVKKKGKTYPVQKCAKCGAPSALTFEKNGETVQRCFLVCNRKPA